MGMWHETVVWAAENASSTVTRDTTAWPYLLISVLITIGLVGTALKVLRN
ncbi:MAG: hypothetical protein RLZZ480_423 [Candidatus Parcubacteria bacterium]|jgi:hypothetical protein